MLDVLIVMEPAHLSNIPYIVVLSFHQILLHAVPSVCIYLKVVACNTIRECMTILVMGFIGFL